MKHRTLIIFCSLCLLYRSALSEDASSSAASSPAPAYKSGRFSREIEKSRKQREEFSKSIEALRQLGATPTPPPQGLPSEGNWKQTYDTKTSSEWRTYTDEKTGQKLSFNPKTEEVRRSPVTGKYEVIQKEGLADNIPTANNTADDTTTSKESQAPATASLPVGVWDISYKGLESSSTLTITSDSRWRIVTTAGNGLPGQVAEGKVILSPGYVELKGQVVEGYKEGGAWDEFKDASCFQPGGFRRIR